MFREDATVVGAPLSWSGTHLDLAYSSWKLSLVAAELATNSSSFTAAGLTEQYIQDLGNLVEPGIELQTVAA